MSVHFSSLTVEWATPPVLFESLQRAFGAFTLDPCADASNAKCPRYFTKEDDGLQKSWAGERVFMNPPYGRQIGRWVRKAFDETSGGGGSAGGLLAARAYRYPVVARLLPRWLYQLFTRPR